jgi:hypothetical protein
MLLFFSAQLFASNIEVPIFARITFDAWIKEVCRCHPDDCPLNFYLEGIDAASMAVNATEEKRKIIQEAAQAAWGALEGGKQRMQEEWEKIIMQNKSY